MKSVCLFLCLLALYAQRVHLVQELKISGCETMCLFQQDQVARHAVIHQGYLVLPGTEKTTDSYNGLASVLYVHKKESNTWKMHKKILLPKFEGKHVDGTLYISLSTGNLLVGFIRNVSGGSENNQQLLMYEEAKNWTITKDFPIKWNFEPRPREGTLRTDVRMTAVAGDYLIHGQWYWHSYGFYVDTPVGATKASGWNYAFGGMNTVWRKQIATGYYNGKPSFLQTIHTHSYVLFNPQESNGRTRFQNSLYGTNSGSQEWGISSAIDKTGEIVVQAAKDDHAKLEIWDKPRNGRGYSYVPDNHIIGSNPDFGASVAVFVDTEKFIVVTDGKGSVLVYVQKTSGSSWELQETLSIPNIKMLRISQVIDDDGSFVVTGKRVNNELGVAFVYKFESMSKQSSNPSSLTK